ncbi:hypothetical protein BG36_18755 [Aquamicrobium defluvii]|uniref:Uncharacterized protein n=1 Tax=Aquamicrobium defluvii TaxID=69279 RepID=A0A011UZG1_9HYPH|nr:hypothetical protein BG36_18755 [Aquamicrobium defluvii]EZQ12755.1 hypothetical protein CF98_34425 [Halopseudomonas bauzanensis]
MSRVAAALRSNRSHRRWAMAIRAPFARSSPVSLASRQASTDSALVPSRKKQSFSAPCEKAPRVDGQARKPRALCRFSVFPQCPHGRPDSYFRDEGKASGGDRKCRHHASSLPVGSSAFVKRHG